MERPRRLAITLNRYTAGGFRPAPDPAPACSLSDAAVLRRAEHASLLWARADASTALCSGNGHLAEAVLSPETTAAVLAWLDPGEAVPLAELLGTVPVA